MTTAISFNSSLLGRIASYTEILNQDPHSTVFLPLADLYRQAGMLDEALEVAEQGAQSLPTFSPGWVLLGRICLERRELDRAISALEKAHAMDPSSLTAMKGLARALVLSGKPGRARQLVREGLGLYPEDAGLKKMLGSLPASQPGGAGRNAAISAPEDEPIATSTIAEIYLKQGLPQRALKVFRDLLQADPGNERLQQKIEELEKGLAPPPVKPAAESRTPDSPASQPAQEFPRAKPAPAPSAGEQHLMILNRWLEVIRERKEHVR